MLFYTESKETIGNSGGDPFVHVRGIHIHHVDISCLMEGNCSVAHTVGHIYSRQHDVVGVKEFHRIGETVLCFGLGIGEDALDRASLSASKI